MSANFAQGDINKFSNNNQRSFNGGNFSGFDNNKNGFNSEMEVIFQIYFIPGHEAFKCRNMFDQDFIPRLKRGGFRPRHRFYYKGFSGPSPNNYSKGFGFHNRVGFGFLDNMDIFFKAILQIRILNPCILKAF